MATTIITAFRYRLRNEDDPYVGLVDCGKRIVNEEGYSTLFRAWWLVLLPMMAMAVVP